MMASTVLILVAQNQQMSNIGDIDEAINTALVS